LSFPHIIRHGLDLYLDLAALALFAAAWVIRWATGNKRGLALYTLVAGWVVFFTYVVRIYR
jgi:hypothetical protein